MRGDIKDGRWEPRLPLGYMIWHETWRTLLGSNGPGEALPLRSLKSCLQEIKFQAKLDHLAHPAARASLYEDLLDAFQRRPDGFVFPAALQLCQSLLKEKLKGAGCPKWREIEASALQSEACIGLAEVRLRLNSIAAFCERPSQSQHSKLKSASAGLILDLLVAGYSAGYVAGLPAIIGAGHYAHGPVLATQFPLELYGLKADPCRREWLETLGLRERLDVIEKLFEAPNEPLQVTFQLRGIRLSEPLTFGDVVVYDPFITERLPRERAVGREGNETTRYPNIEIAVRGRYFDHESVLFAARQAIGHHLDAISAFAGTGSPLDLQTSSYVISNDGAPLVSGRSTSAESHPWVRYVRGPDLTDTDQRAPLSQALAKPALRGIFNASPLARVENKLGFALGACRRGETAERPQQALLEYWSALEALIDAGSGPDDPGSAIERIVRLVPAVQFFQTERFEVGWRLLPMLRGLHEQQPFPPRLAAAAYLDSVRGQTMVLRNLVVALPEIRAALEAPGGPQEFWQWHIQHAESFYALSNVTLDHMKRFEIAVERDLKMAYRHRNRIVHDGCDVDGLIQEVVYRLRATVYSVLYFALRELGESSNNYRRRLAAVDVRWLSLRKGLQEKNLVGFALDTATGADEP